MCFFDREQEAGNGKKLLRPLLLWSSGPGSGLCPGEARGGSLSRSPRRPGG